MFLLKTLCIPQKSLHILHWRRDLSKGLFLRSGYGRRESIRVERYLSLWCIQFNNYKSRSLHQAKLSPVKTRNYRNSVYHKGT